MGYSSILSFGQCTILCRIDEWTMEIVFKAQCIRTLLLSPGFSFFFWFIQTSGVWLCLSEKKLMQMKSMSVFVCIINVMCSTYIFFCYNSSSLSTLKFIESEQFKCSAKYYRSKSFAHHVIYTHKCQSNDAISRW